jgi:hypothetical protein
MLNEILYYILSVIAGIVVMIRLGFLRRFLPAFLEQRIRTELSRLKTSTPDLNSTFDGNNSASPR